ncbi:HlyD family secretion protein [Elioraea sp.]|uniref:HlyD family secretion protein n=1 Tax=Elioraea sp. TaxID=2185103 RepID=UPI0021DCE3C0|nr:HlyD family secretion protein [Elioraea sp.]GIX09710.1 MAG: hypothetical protein KatS3mg116_1420 [Elioraea sp.]
MLARRFGRILLGAGLLGAAAYAFAPHLTNRISTAAVVNSELIRIVAPIDGLADEGLPAPGTVLAAGQVRPLVRRLVAEERELHRLAHDLALVRAQIAEARRGLDLLDGHDAALAARAAAHARSVRDRLAAELAEARAEHAGAEAAIQQARADLAHLRSLLAARHVAPVRVEAAEAALRRAEAAAEALAARIARLEIERQAAEAGLQLRDGQNDVPYTVQQRDRVMLERRQLADRLAEAEAREGALAAALAAEQAALEARSRYAYAAPDDLVVWERHATPGAPVKPGDPLLDLVRCDRLFVEVALPDTAYSALATGQTAHVKLRGDVALDGTIRSIRGAGARSRKTLLAAERPGEHGARLTVEVALPRDAAARITPEAEGGFCGIGRIAEVSFPVNLGVAGGLAERLADLARRLGAAAGWAIGLVSPSPAARAAAP